jgi:protein-L-isoaspartate(D-aspartate) O-methyltransferase
MTDFAAQRLTMLDNQIRPSDVTDLRLLDVLGEVPRELFVPADLQQLAYIDRHLELTNGSAGQPPRYLMQPAPFARLVQLAAIQATDKVLVVGAASGYAAAVVGSLAKSVVALEEDVGLVATAKQALAQLGLANIEIVSAPLIDGAPAGAPYDVILFVGAVSVMPPALPAQLAERGRLVVVEGHGPSARAMLYVRTGADVTGRAVFNCAAKALPGFEMKPAFQF